MTLRNTLQHLNQAATATHCCPADHADGPANTRDVKRCTLHDRRPSAPLARGCPHHRRLTRNHLPLR
jgi:hypothetical protein